MECDQFLLPDSALATCASIFPSVPFGSAFAFSAHFGQQVRTSRPDTITSVESALIASPLIGHLVALYAGLSFAISAVSYAVSYFAGSLLKRATHFLQQSL